MRGLWASDRQARGRYEGQERPGRMELGSAALPEGASLTCTREWPWLCGLGGGGVLRPQPDCEIWSLTFVKVIFNVHEWGTKRNSFFISKTFRELSGGPVVRTPHFCGKGHEFHLWLGN